MNEELTLAQRLLGIMHLVRRRMDADLRHLHDRPAVDPAHFPILMSLRRREYSVSELADRFKVSPPSMSKTVTALVNRGWVVRVRSEKDRRIVQVSLTDEGRAILGEMREQADSVVAAMLDPLSPEEREQLSAGLDALYATLGESLDQIPQVPHKHLRSKQLE